MKLIELTEQDKSRYNAFVAAQPSGSFLQSWNWGEWQEACGRTAYRFFGAAENQPDKILFSIQLLKHQLSKKRYYLYAPYGPVVDFRFEIADFRSITQELSKRFSDALFIRIEPKSGLLPTTHYPLLTKTVHIQPVTTLVLDLTKPMDQLLAEMHPKTRYNIRLAQKHGVEIKSDLVVVPGHGLYWSESLRLITATAKRQNFKTFPNSYYQRMLDFFGVKNGGSEFKIYVYRALYERELLAAAVMVDFGGVRTYLFGGSADAHREVMAPHLLHHQAISDAKSAGLKCYDFWGLDTAKEKNPGFARFKLGFGGDKLEYPGAFDYVIDQNHYRAYKVLRIFNRIKNKFWKA